MWKNTHLTSKVAWCVGCLSLLAVAVFAVGTMPGGSAATRLASGRDVSIHSDAFYLTSTYSRDTATIHTAGKTIVVRPGCIVVDGDVLATIDQNTAAIEIRVRRGSIQCLADGNVVWPIVTPP